MKRLRLIPLFVACLTTSMINTSFSASGLASIGSSISSNADNQLINALNLPLPFVTSAWTMLSNYYSQNSSFAPTGIYAVDTSMLSGVMSITNSGNGTLEVRYGMTAPGPMAGKGYALAPTRVTLRGNTFYVYQLVQCFTNIADSLTTLNAPQEGATSSIFGNSNLGTNCTYASDPYGTAIAQVQGSGRVPVQPNGVSS